MAVTFVYMTAGSREEAEAIGRVLVTQKLAACVNIFENMQSIYEWNDAVETAREVVMIAKTTDDKLETMTERVRSMHSYECPCIVGLQAAGGNPDFLRWIADQVR